MIENITDKIIKKTEALTKAEYEQLHRNFTKSEKLYKKAADREYEIYTILKTKHEKLCIIHGLSALQLCISAREWDLYERFKEDFRSSIHECTPDVSLAIYNEIREMDIVKSAYLTPLTCVDCGKEFVLNDVINDFRSANTPSCLMSNKDFLRSEVKRCYECDFLHDRIS